MSTQAAENLIECDLECLGNVLRVFAGAFKNGFGDSKINELVQSVEKLNSGKRCRSRFTVEGADNSRERLLVQLKLEDDSTVEIRVESSTQVVESVKKLLPQALEVAEAPSTTPAPSSDELARGQEQLWAERREQRLAESRDAWELIYMSLREAGVNVHSFTELKQFKDFKKAVPILLEWLDRTSHVDTKWAILRLILQLRVRPVPYRELLGAWERTVPTTSYDESTKWAMAEILERLAVKKLPVEDLLRVVKDKRHGRARQMLVLGLGKVKDPRAVNTLMYLLSEGDLVAHALSGLGKHNAPEAIPLVEQYVTSKDALIRSSSRKTLAKLQKARQQPSK